MFKQKIISSFFLCVFVHILRTRHKTSTEKEENKERSRKTN